MAREVLAGAVLDVQQRADARRARQLQIERAIVEYNPDTVEAAEVLQALMAAVRQRYGDRAVDVLERMNEAREALDELERTLSAYEGPDAMDLSRADRQRRDDEAAERAS